MRIKQQHQAIKRPRRTHIFQRDPGDCYVEPHWCSERLFQEEIFHGPVHDPAAGTGRILKAARAAGLTVTGADNAPPVPGMRTIDFLADNTARVNVVCNPPYKDNSIQMFAEHALAVTERKVCMLIPSARLNAAHWIEVTPLHTIWLLQPRPSIPPLSVILSGMKPEGGRPDFCWLMWEQRYRGAPQLRWLHRDSKTATATGSGDSMIAATAKRRRAKHSTHQLDLFEGLR
jgi:hypothetical protein